MKENIVILTLFYKVDGLYIIPLWVVTCHANYASNICDLSASYFYSGVRDTPRQYRNISVFNHKSSPRSLFTLRQTTRGTGVYIMTHTTISDSVPKVFSLPHILNKNLIIWKDDQRFKNMNVNMTMKMVLTLSASENTTSKSSSDT